MKIANLIGSLVGMAVAVFFFYHTFAFPVVQSQETGPAFMPRIFAVALMILSIILLIQSFFTKEKAPETKMKMIGLTMGIVLIYLLLIPTLGFYSSTILFVLVLILITKLKKPILLVVIPVAVPLFVFVFFEKMLRVPIPTGILF